MTTIVSSDELIEEFEFFSRCMSAPDAIRQLANAYQISTNSVVRALRRAGYQFTGGVDNV